LTRVVKKTYRWSSVPLRFGEPKAFTDESNFTAGAEADHSVATHRFALLESVPKLVDVFEWNLQDSYAARLVVDETVFMLNFSSDAFVGCEEIHQAHGLDADGFAQRFKAGLNFFAGVEGWVDEHAHPPSFSSQGLGQSLRHVLAKPSLFKRFHS